MKKLKEKIDVAIKRKIQLTKDLEAKDTRIEQLLEQLEFYKSQAAKVEGLIDENVKQANKIEDLLAEIEEVNRQVDANLVG